jgi:hypothetical protein
MSAFLYTGVHSGELSMVGTVERLIDAQVTDYRLQVCSFSGTDAKGRRVA